MIFNKHLDSGHSMFTIHRGKDNVALLVYVDDVVLSGTSTIFLTEIKEFINTLFQIKYLGTLRYFLGLEITSNSNGIF